MSKDDQGGAERTKEDQGGAQKEERLELGRGGRGEARTYLGQ
jgi:hypothetical protein